MVSVYESPFVVALFYANRTADSIIFDAELRALEEQHRGRLTVVRHDDTAAGFVTAYPDGMTRPVTSGTHWGAGQIAFVSAVGSEARHDFIAFGDLIFDHMVAGCRVEKELEILLQPLAPGLGRGKRRRVVIHVVLGQQPATGQAVQGQTAAQPEGTVLNLVNWVGNVISPVGAALAVVMAVVSYSQGRGVARWAVTAGGLLVISGLTRLIEFWIQNGTAGVQ